MKRLLARLIWVLIWLLIIVVAAFLLWVFLRERMGRAPLRYRPRD